VTPARLDHAGQRDINPYAIWPVTETVGTVTKGDIFVGNLNNSSNNQGTGTTIVDMHPAVGSASSPAYPVRWMAALVVRG